MKNYLRKMAGAAISLILVFMVIAVLRYTKEEDTSLLEGQYELTINESWNLVMVNGGGTAGLEDQDRIRDLVLEELVQGKGMEVDLPYAGTGRAGDIYVFTKELPDIYMGHVLNISSTDVAISVVLDGKVIYCYGLEEGDDTGSSENFVSIPNVMEEGEVWIELAPLRSDGVFSIGDVKVETRDVVVIGVVGNSITDIGCCLLIVIMAIIMFVLALIRRYTGQPTRGEFFLGLTGLAAGIYCFIETDTLSLFYDIQAAYEMQEYLVLLIPLFLTLYYGRNLQERYPRRFSALLWCVSINAAVQILLQVLGVCSMRDMWNLSAAAVGAVCVVAVVSLIQSDNRGRNYRIWLSALALLVLLAVGVVITIMNVLYQGAYGHRAGQYSMVVFGIVMAFMHVFQLSQEYRANAEKNARLLEEKVKVVEQQNTLLAQAREEAETARREALAANEAKGKFLAKMSHEIRTPINAVLGMDEMILRESGEQNIKEYAMDIYTAGHTLLSLINDILDFSKIDSGKMEIVPIEYDFSSLVHDLAQMTLRRAQDKDIRFEVEVDHDIPSRLYGDDVRIRQVLTNILTNAVKYTPEGCVWLRIQGRKTGENAVLRFEVEDTGIGIKKEDLPRLSAEFERIEEERNRNIEGTGLGMSITVQLLALMDSRLQVESIYGEGSKFYFELEQRIVDYTPIGDFKSRVQQAAADYSYGAKFCAPDAKILVVDDNAVNRKVLRNLLKETQIQVTDAEGGEECLKLVQQNHYDLIFLDHMMPGMDGVETLHHMRKLSDYPCRNTPIVVLTANAVAGAKEKYLGEGFDDFLSKPIVPEKLENMIQKMLPEELIQEVVGDQFRQVLPQQAAAGGPGEFLEELPQVDGLDWNYAWLHLPDRELLAFTVKAFYAQIDSAADILERAYGQILESGQAEQLYGLPGPAVKEKERAAGLGQSEQEAAGFGQSEQERAAGLGQSEQERAAGLGQSEQERVAGVGQSEREQSAGVGWSEQERAAELGQPEQEQSAGVGWSEREQSAEPGQTEKEQAAEPLDQYRIQVHAMKSLAATVGIIPLAGVAKILEYAARDGKRDVLMSMTAAFLEEWRSYGQKLQGVFGIGTVEKEEVTDYSVILALVEMVRLAMQEMDVDQADRLMGQLQVYRYPDEMEQNIQELALAVTNLDMEEADRLAGLLAGQMEG